MCLSHLLLSCCDVVFRAVEIDTPFGLVEDGKGRSPIAIPRLAHRAGIDEIARSVFQVKREDSTISPRTSRNLLKDPCAIQRKPALVVCVAEKDQLHTLIP